MIIELNQYTDLNNFNLLKERVDKTQLTLSFRSLILVLNYNVKLKSYLFLQN